MLDSATNNRQRFVRAGTEGSYTGPSYAQEAWVAAHGYGEQSWVTLLRWWEVEHEILVAVVDRIPEERLEASCVIGAEAPVTLRFVIEDYLRHQRGHLAQLTSAGYSGIAEQAISGAKKPGVEPGSFACLVLQVAAATWLPSSQGPS